MRARARERVLCVAGAHVQRVGAEGAVPQGVGEGGLQG